MGLLKKLFIEEEPDLGHLLDNGDYEVEIPIVLDEVNNDTLISDIYSENGLSDGKETIFKVEELVNALPKEMVTDTKRASVISAITVFGLTMEGMIEDGKSRADVLAKAKEKIISDTRTKVTDKENTIETLKMEIASIEEEIEEMLKEGEESVDSIQEEEKRVNDLMRFIGGMQ